MPRLPNPKRLEALLAEVQTAQEAVPHLHRTDLTEAKVQTTSTPDLPEWDGLICRIGNCDELVTDEVVPPISFSAEKPIALDERGGAMRPAGRSAEWI